MSKEITRVVLYLRYSSNAQSEQSIEGQMHVCESFCTRNNYAIVQSYIDRALSASKNTDKRIQFAQMLKDAESGNFDAVVVYKLDRFARDRYDFAMARYRLKKCGVAIISATENLSDSPESIILESVLEGMAEFYSAELSQKVSRGMRETAAKHNSVGGVALGYKVENKKYVIDPITAPIIKEIFQLYANGVSIADICKSLNEKGYRTSAGKPFNRSSFNRILRNERYIGVYKYLDYRAENGIPAIIDKPLWDAVQLRLNSPRPGGCHKADIPYLLAGKLFCGHCGNKMNGESGISHTKAKYYYYSCYAHKRGKGCLKRSVKKDWIETIVLQNLRALLTKESIDKISSLAVAENKKQINNGTRIPLLEEKIRDNEKATQNIIKVIEKGISSDSLIERIHELEQEKQELLLQLAIEKRGVAKLSKEEITYYLSQFSENDFENETLNQSLIDLLINSVTIWDEPDGNFKIVIAYNLEMYPTQTFKLNPTGYDLQKFYRVQTPQKVDKIQECKSQSPKASKVINKVSGGNLRSASNKPRAKSREKRSNKVQKGSDNCEEVSGSDTANGGPPICRIVLYDAAFFIKNLSEEKTTS